MSKRHLRQHRDARYRLLESWMIPFDEDGSFDKVRMADILFEGVRGFFTAPLAYRAAHPGRESQIVDCLYHDLFRDPIGVVKAIYAKFDLEYTQVFEDRMRVYLGTHD